MPYGNFTGSGFTGEADEMDPRFRPEMPVQEAPYVPASLIKAMNIRVRRASYATDIIHKRASSVSDFDIKGISFIST